MVEPAIFPIVEGHGDVVAIPLLLRRLAESLGIVPLDVLPPYRIPRGRLLEEQDDALARALALARAKLSVGRVKSSGTVLIVVDGDDDCPKQLAEWLRQRARSAAPDLRVEVAVAQREFEAWFIAAARSLRELRGVRPDADPPAEPEDIRGAKEWLEKNLLRTDSRYSDTADQPRFAAAMDLEEARRCRSFRHLVTILQRNASRSTP